MHSFLMQLKNCQH